MLQGKPKFQYVEAFCLMLYACEECGHREILWNSRDGVTPFTIGCTACEMDLKGTMSHINFAQDYRTGPKYRPWSAMRIFVNISKEQHKVYKTAFVNQWWGDPKSMIQQTYGTKEKAVEELCKDFKEGEPDVCLASQWPEEAKKFSHEQKMRLMTGNGRHG